MNKRNIINNMEEPNQLVYNESLRKVISDNIVSFEVKSNKKPDLKKAAVAITVVELNNDLGVYGADNSELPSNHPAIILTKRTSRLNKHAGQWALPGGRMDDGETPEQTALRELSEEVGLFLSEDKIVGRLDDYTTRSGYNITPVVVWGGSNIELNPNPSEVGSIHRISFQELLRKDAPLLHEMSELEHPAMMMPVGDSWIAAPTGAIIYQFREVAILNKPTRVAHYEQPYFAWS